MSRPAPPDAPTASPTAPEPAGGDVNLPVGAVARRLGVAPATLRTWARRYGLGPSAHVAGAHRRYSPQDLARLDLMRRMVDSGVAPGDAAHAAKAARMLVPSHLEGGPAPGPGPAVPGDDPTRPGPGRSGAAPGAPPGLAGDPLGPPLRPGSGPATRGLAQAVLALDGTACLDLIVSALAGRGVVWAWEELLVPVLTELGTRCEQTGQGIAAEHLLTTAATAAFSSVVLRTRDHQDLRPALLACADDEQHSLPLWATAAALTERHVPARVLGARVPHPALVAAIRRIGPCATLLWSSSSQTGDLAALHDLPGLRPAPLLLVGGPGWHGVAPEGVQQCRSLREAVERIAGAAR